MDIEEELNRPNPLIKLLTSQWFLDRYRMAMRDLEEDPFVTQLFSDYMGRYELEAMKEFGWYSLDSKIQALKKNERKVEHQNTFNEMVSVLMYIDAIDNDMLPFKYHVNAYDLCHIWFITCSQDAKSATVP